MANATELPMDNVKLVERLDGLWLNFTASNGKSATISVAHIAENSGPIVRSALRSWCRDRKADAVQPFNEEIRGGY